MEERRERTIMRTCSIGPTQYCSTNKARHIPAVLRHPYRRPTQPPTLPCTRILSMQSIDRAWRTTRNQPPAIGLDSRADNGGSRRPLWPRIVKGGRRRISESPRKTDRQISFLVRLSWGQHRILREHTLTE